MDNQLQTIKKETMLATTNSWLKRLSAFADSNKLVFDKYQQDIVVNTVRKIQESGYDIYSFEQNNVADVLYQTAFLRLNPSAMPRHCYFMSRNIYENGKVAGSKLEVNIEGEGNDEILRNFGFGIKKSDTGQNIGIHKVWIIYENDFYEEGYYNGLQYQPPVWKPKQPKIGETRGRILKVVYPIEMENGSVEYWSAERDALQPILLKHIEQNLNSYKKADAKAYNALFAKLKGMAFDDILKEYGDATLTFTYYGKQQTVNVIQDSYTGATGEAMVLRKLRNVAVRTFPKNFNKTVLEKIYETTFEERYDRPAIETLVQDKLETEKQENAGKIKVDAGTIPDVEITLEPEPRVTKQQERITEKNSVVDAEIQENIQENIQEPKFEEIEEIDESMFN